MVVRKECLMVTRASAASARKSNNGSQPPAEPPAGMKLTVDRDILRNLYARMLLCNSAVEQARGIFEYPDAHGIEAIIASTIDLRPGDALSASSTSRLLQLALGTPLAHILTPQPEAGAPASSAPNQLQLHLLPARAAASSQLVLAAGVALGFQVQKTKAVVIALSNVGTLNFGPSHEALRFAAVHKLPLVVVVQSDQAPSSDDWIAKAAAYGIPGIAVDGLDPVAVYRVSREAIHRARDARGPSLVECQSVPSGVEPIRRMEHYLDKHGWWTAAWKRRLAADYKREIARAISSARRLRSTTKN